MITVAYLDQATVSGLAWSTDLGESDLHSTTFSVFRDTSPGPPQHRAERHVLFQRTWRRWLEWLEPDFVGYEKPPTRGRFIGHEPLMHNLGYAALIEIECMKAKVPFAPINGKKVQSRALGGGKLTTAAIKVAHAQLIRLGYSRTQARDNARKHALCLAARSRGWQVRDDNEADALFGLDFICDLIRKGELRIDGQ